MDEGDGGPPRDTETRGAHASGASGEHGAHTGDPLYDALLAAIGEPRHARPTDLEPTTTVSSTFAEFPADLSATDRSPAGQTLHEPSTGQRRRVELIKQRVRPAPDGAAPEQGLAAWAGTGEAVRGTARADAGAAGLPDLALPRVDGALAPAEVARSDPAAPSRLTRTLGSLRELGPLGVPLATLLAWLLRPHLRWITPAALAFAVPLVVAVVALLPSTPSPAEAPSASPATALPARPVPVPRDGLGMPAPAYPGPAVKGVPPTGAGGGQLATPGPGAVPEEGGTSAGGGSVAPGAPGAAPPTGGAVPPDGPGPAPDPDGRSQPTEPCEPQPVLGELGCVLADLIDGVAGGQGDRSVSPPQLPPGVLPLG